MDYPARGVCILVCMETQSTNANPGGARAGMADGGRFAPYVAELREFFAGRGMGFGAPEDLAAFAQALNEPGTFREELASLTRSVVYREQGTIAVTELLELMMVAMGGARIAEAGEAVREPVRELLGFLGKAMRGRAGALDDVEARDVARDVGPVDVVADVDGVVDRTAGTAEAVDAFHPHASTEFYSRARSISMGVEDGEFTSESTGPELMSGGDFDAEPSLVRRPAALALRQTVSADAKRSRLEWGLFAGAAAGVAVAAVMFVLPWAPVAEQVEEPTVSVVGTAEGAAAGGSSDSGAGVAAARPDASGSVGKAKPPAGDPMPSGATNGTHGGPTHTSASMGSLPSRGVYTVSPGVMAAKLISAPAPEYPKLAGLIHMEGQVTLQAVVGRDGKVVATHVLQGHRLLQGAASDAVRQWRYRPYLVNGQPAGCGDSCYGELSAAVRGWR